MTAAARRLMVTGLTLAGLLVLFIPTSMVWGI